MWQTGCFIIPMFLFYLSLPEALFSTFSESKWINDFFLRSRRNNKKPNHQWVIMMCTHGWSMQYVKRVLQWNVSKVIARFYSRICKKEIDKIACHFIFKLLANERYQVSGYGTTKKRAQHGLERPCASYSELWKKIKNYNCKQKLLSQKTF